MIAQVVGFGRRGTCRAGWQPSRKLMTFAVVHHGQAKRVAGGEGGAGQVESFAPWVGVRDADTRCCPSASSRAPGLNVLTSYPLRR
jgi:hypothetical protein